MYSRFLSNLCEWSVCRASSYGVLQASRLSHVANKNERKQEAAIAQARFPGYKMIYAFPFVKYASALNSAKRRFTYLVGAFVPIVVGLQSTDVISSSVAISSIASGVILTTWLHVTGIPCYNLVGYIYTNQDEKKVILSYMDYWGKRIDLKTAFDDIIPLSDNPIAITDPVYRKIFFSSRELKLKIYLRFGQIIDVDKFRYILGAS